MTYLRKIKAYGTEDHDDADDDGPIKIGGKAIDSEPYTAGSQAPTEVAENDRVNAWLDLSGRTMTGVEAKWSGLADINYVYTAGTCQSSSCWVDCYNFREASVAFNLNKNGTPTDIVFSVETCPSGSGPIVKLSTPGWISDWRYDDGSVGTAGIQDMSTFPICAYKMRVTVDVTGTDGSNWFSISSASLYLRN